MSPITAALDAEYASIPALPSLPAIDAILTMRPYPAFFMEGKQVLQKWKIPEEHQLWPHANTFDAAFDVHVENKVKVRWVHILGHYVGFACEQWISC